MGDEEELESAVEEGKDAAEDVRDPLLGPGASHCFHAPEFSDCTSILRFRTCLRVHPCIVPPCVGPCLWCCCLFTL